MESDPNAAGTLYIDGHVRVYNGGLTKLPKRHVSRERLCLRGTTDFWVNYKVFGILGLTFAFIATQLPFIHKHGNFEEEEK